MSATCTREKTAARGWIFYGDWEVAELETEKKSTVIKIYISVCVHSCNFSGCNFQRQRHSAMAALTSISQPVTGKGIEQLQMNHRKTQVTAGQAK